ncbi:hypothetical protein HA402_007875 [Bradysia odoriphaga]|nr:hypothetical protein HA402_007875 [Bradysia odoriphaga]
MLLKGVPITALLLFVSIGRGDDGFKAEKRQFPFSALIVANYNNSIINNLGEWDCSGALISDKFVITAGLCVEGVQKFRIKLGERGEVRDNEDEYVYDHIIHTKPIYSINHIVALIALNPMCNLTPEIQPVRIPVNPSNVNNWLIVAGWNANNDNDLELQWLPMRVISDADCKAVYPAIDMSTVICARTDEINGKRRSLCGSLGAVLVAENNTLLGISIWQISSPCQDGPQIFARIKWFNPWISAAFEITRG